MKISLIGMSGSGKSYWAHKLQNAGFTRYSIDDLLEKKLEIGLKQLGYSGLRDLSKWMRQPYEDRYKRTSATYLDYERKTMQEILSIIDSDQSDDDTVIDTTGSVIYMDEHILSHLAGTTTVVYLETPASVQKELYKLYLADPKPVIWGEIFTKNQDESNRQALARCYPQLLAFRSKRYEKLAHIKLDYYTLRKKEFSLDAFTTAVRGQMNL